MAHDPFGDIFTLVQLLFVGAIDLMLLAVLVVFAAINYRGFVRYWRISLLLGLLVGLLNLPAVIYSLFYFDPGAALQADGIHASGAMEHRLAVAVHAVVTILGLGWSMMVTYLACYVTICEWSRMQRDAMPVLTGRSPTPWRGLMTGAVLGLVTGLLGGGLMYWLGVDVSDFVKQQMLAYPDAENAPLVVQFSVLLTYVSSAAIDEELLFRGVLLGVLMVRISAAAGPVVIWVIFTSLIFALMHLLNTDAPMTKVMQTFLLGVLFAELARRSCIEAAMICHLVHNLAATALELVLPTPVTL